MLTRQQQIAYFKSLVENYPIDEMIGLYLDIATDYALQTLYPFVSPRPTLPTDYDMWVVLAAKDLFESIGSGLLKSYAENGISITYRDMSSGISVSLLSMLIPYAGVPS